MYWIITTTNSNTRILNVTTTHTHTVLMVMMVVVNKDSSPERGVRVCQGSDKWVGGKGGDKWKGRRRERERMMEIERTSRTRVGPETHCYYHALSSFLPHTHTHTPSFFTHSLIHTHLHFSLSHTHTHLHFSPTPSFTHTHTLHLNSSPCVCVCVCSPNNTRKETGVAGVVKRESVSWRNTDEWTGLIFLVYTLTQYWLIEWLRYTVDATCASGKPHRVHNGYIHLVWLVGMIGVLW